MTKPLLTKTLDPHVFLDYYYLKEELVNFCRKENLQPTGNKEDLTNRIYYYLKTGEKTTKKLNINRKSNIKEISLTSIIEENFVCSEVHRSFFKEQIGKTFSFNVIFQKWLKENSGKTYADSISAYYKILEEKKQGKTKIDKQFEYNTYIRDFFDNNKDKSLKDAIKCWKYKKSTSGHNKYEKEDLKVLE